MFSLRSDCSVRTLLISEIFPPRTGGSGRWFWEIYRRLPREEVVIAAGEDGRQEAFDATHDLRLWRVPLTMREWGIRSWAGLRGYGRALRRLRRIVKAEGISRVHCGRCLPEGVMALALKWLCGTPYLCYVHGEDVTTAATSREHRWLVQRVFRGAERVIVNSRNTGQIVREEWGLLPERIALLHPGVDSERFQPHAWDGRIRARLGWGDRPVLLTVGRLQKRKGHDHLIRALPQVRRTIPALLYAIVGDGEERDSLQQLARDQGVTEHVQFLGEIADEELVACYQQCDLFVLPNRQVGHDIEGFGMVLLEAQACGKPVLAGASGGTAETMRIPDTGRVVPCDDVPRLAAAVSELLADPPLLARLGTAGRQWVVEQFDWSALVRQAQLLFRGGPCAMNPVSPLPAQT
jgi:phosphatidylinositol alpha-1,6-mannosyltransferase